MAGNQLGPGPSGLVARPCGAFIEDPGRPSSGISCRGGGGEVYPWRSSSGSVQERTLLVCGLLTSCLRAKQPLLGKYGACHAWQQPLD